MVEATATLERVAPPLARRPSTTLSIDTGGTFTDGYLTDGTRATRVKVDTTPDDLSRGVLSCVDAAAASWNFDRLGLLRRLDVIRLSTTVGTNTLINRNGPAVGLLVGRGLADKIPTLADALPLPPDAVQIVDDDADEAAEPDVLTAVHRLLEQGARIIVIALSGLANLPTREMRVRGIITTDYPRHYLGAVPIVPSHQVTACPDGRVRIQTAVLNAYLHPVMSRFLYRVEDELRRSGYPHPLLVANADGGTSRVAKTTALRTWGSGPAGGVAGAVEMARALGLTDAVTLDVGGTSSDIAVVRGGRWTYAVQPAIQGIEVSLPVIELVSAGIGGGSFVRATDGRLTVGPDSAGAQPGPVCFGLGGETPTITDAALVLGILGADNYLGGRKELDQDGAKRALAAVGERLGLDEVEVARQAITLGANRIADVIRQQVAAAGLRHDETTLFSTGGGGGMFAALVARSASLRGVVAFPVSPVFSAFGLSRLEVQHMYEVATPAVGMLESALADARNRAVRDMIGEGVDPALIEFSLEGEVESDGVVIPVPFDLLGPGVSTAQLDGVRVLRLRAVARETLPPLVRVNGSVPKPRGSRSLLVESMVPTEAPVLDWDALEPGVTVAGPVIVESDATTVLVPSFASAHTGTLGELHLQLDGAGSG